MGKPVATIVGGILGFLFTLILAYALVAWAVVAAVNLFVDPNYSFTFWQYALIGWVLAIVTGMFKRRG